MKPPLGSPENPEIIEPGETPRAAQAAPAVSRWALAAQVCMWIFSVSLPAAGLDLLVLWLMRLGWQSGSVLPLFMLCFIALPALLMTLTALVANVVLVPALFFILFGKQRQLPLNDPRFARFTRIRPFGD